jgi:hypothetical protein
LTVLVALKFKKPGVKLKLVCNDHWKTLAFIFIPPTPLENETDSWETLKSLNTSAEMPTITILP